MASLKPPSQDCAAKGDVICLTITRAPRNWRLYVRSRICKRERRKVRARIRKMGGRIEAQETGPRIFGAGGGSRTHTGRLALRIFMPSTAFAARTRRLAALTPGLRSGLSLHHPPEGPGLRCCPSSLYTFPNGCLPSGLGSGLPFQVSPNLGSSASPVSRRALKFFSSPLRMPFRHARACRLLATIIIKQASGIYTSVSGVDGRGRLCVLVCFPGWFLLVCFGFGRMMLIAAASRFVLMCAA
jgi:hypothetical protein